jgi:hypothetical protein
MIASFCLTSGTPNFGQRGYGGEPRRVPWIDKELGAHKGQQKNDAIFCPSTVEQKSQKK